MADLYKEIIKPLRLVENYSYSNRNLLFLNVQLRH